MNGKVYTGHVGDSRIVLGRKNPETGMWIPKALTKDHKPDSPEEKERISKAGGEVMNKSGVERVVWFRPKNGHKGPIRRSTNIDKIPFLAVARSLGDLWSYNPDNDIYVVSPEPDVSVTPLTDDDKCLVLASDGLTNMLLDYESVRLVQEVREPKECEAFLLKSLKQSRMQTKKNPSELLVHYALQKWGSSCLRADNTSAVTLILNPSKTSSPFIRTITNNQVPPSTQPMILPQTGLPSAFKVTSNDPEIFRLTEEDLKTRDEDFGLLSPSMQSLCKFTKGSIDSLSPKFTFRVTPCINEKNASITDIDNKRLYINDLPDESFNALSDSLKLKTASSPRSVNGVTVVTDFDDDVLDGPSIPGKRDQSCSVSEGLMEATQMRMMAIKAPITVGISKKETECTDDLRVQTTIPSTPIIPELHEQKPLVSPAEERVLKPVDSFATNLDHGSTKIVSEASGSKRGKKRRKSKQLMNYPTKRLRSTMGTTRSGLVLAKAVYQRVTHSLSGKSRGLRSKKPMVTKM
jgi:serine/threonine protein phosphatase PrpC